MFEDLLIPLTVVGLAELGDKTQLSIFLLASKTKRHLYLLIGAILAFLVVDGIAILAGEWVASLLPANYIKFASGIIFVVFGIFIIRSKREETKREFYSKNPLFLGFTLIFLSEWGDKTQIATGLFTTQYDATLVLSGVMIGLTMITIFSIYLGKFISSKINEKTITKIAGVLFIIIGVSFFFL